MFNFEKLETWQEAIAFADIVYHAQPESVRGALCGSRKAKPHAQRLAQISRSSLTLNSQLSTLNSQPSPSPPAPEADGEATCWPLCIPLSLHPPQRLRKDKMPAPGTPNPGHNFLPQTLDWPERVATIRPMNGIPLSGFVFPPRSLSQSYCLDRRSVSLCKKY